ncbi:MAG TPA: CHC2 zinc finger domain-containing protein [Chloroflexota bacterium]|nr:CHC2 zinc finger domain-containing protein [Chloroflexota bacterium]
MAWIDTDALKRDHPVEEVVERYGIELRDSGCALIGRCPFHEDGGRPNLYVYPITRSWYCYRCGIGGDVISLVERIEGVGFREAVTRLTGDARELPGASQCRKRRIKRPPGRQTPWEPEERECLSAAAELYHNRLLTDEAALAYLAGRGLGRDIMERCCLGYSSGDELVNYLCRRRLPIQAARRVGLLRAGGCERFTGRVVVPEIRSGQPIWLIGRTIDETLGHPKYLGLPGSKPLLGWETAKESAGVFLVEGVFDWLTLLNWGYPALALVGTHARPEVFSKLTRFEHVYLLLDSDEPGRCAAENIARRLGPRAETVRLPGAKDVAELATHVDGHAVLAHAIQSGRNLAA